MSNISLFRPSFFQNLFSHDHDIDLAFINRNTALPRSTIDEDDTQYNIEVFVPGVSKEDLNITLEHHYLYISSKKEKDTKREERKNYEYNFIFFIRQEVDEKKITAKLSKGILHVVLPKKEKEIPHQIEIIEIQE